jgi:hypothetical protein
MVDRLCCTVFLQQQQAQEQALHIGDACQPSIDDGIFTSINHVRHAIGDSADRVMLLLFLLKGEGGASSTLSTVSQNSTPVRHHQLLPVPRALPAAPQLPISSIFLPTLPRQDSLMLIPLLGEMQVTPFHVCIFHFNSQTSLPAKCHVCRQVIGAEVDWRKFSSADGHEHLVVEQAVQEGLHLHIARDGVRLRQAPFTRERVKAALAAATTSKA